MKERAQTFHFQCYQKLKKKFVFAFNNTYRKKVIGTCMNTTYKRGK